MSDELGGPGVDRRGGPRWYRFSPLLAYLVWAWEEGGTLVSYLLSVQIVCIFVIVHTIGSESLSS